MLIVGAVAFSRLLGLWVGDRVWSWRAFRFKTRDAVDQLEQYANSTESDRDTSDRSSPESDTLESVD